MKSLLIIISIVMLCLIPAQVVVSEAWAMGPAPAGGQGGGLLGLIPIILWIIIIGVFSFLIFRRTKKQKQMQTANQSPGLTSKIGSVLLLFIGAALTPAALSPLFRFGAMDTSSIFITVIGIGLIWGGSKLWHKWQLALGFIFIWVGFSHYIPLYLSMRGREIAPDVKHASIFTGSTLLLFGFVLIIFQKFYAKKKT